jgi:uncharacterized protein (TIGR03437 family)
VQLRSSIPIYDVVTATYLEPVSRTYGDVYTSSVLWVSPAYAATNQQYLRVFAFGKLSVANALPATAALLGPGTAPSQNIQHDSPYILMDFLNLGGVTAGPRHLVMTFNTSQGPDLFVVPDAITVVNNGPPAISSLTQNGDGSVTVAAAGLTPDSRIFFDGLQAPATTPFAATDATDGAITVMPPQGASGQVSTVTVYTADNQNSMLLQSSAPVTYAYPATAAPQVAAVSPSALPSGINADGVSAMVDITATNSNFVDGQVTVGFGTSDIAVRRVWVLSPTHLVADVVVQNNAAVGAATVNVISGFQVLSQPAALQIQPANFGLPTPALPVFNAVSYATVLHDADYVSIFGSNLSQNGSQVSLNGGPMTVLYSSANQINFQIPAGFPSGPATLLVNNGATNAFPVYVQIDSPPAVINAPPSSTAQAVNPGDIVSLQVTNVDPGIVSSPSRVQVTLSGVPMSVLGVTALSSTVFQIQFAVTQSFAGQQVPLVVCVDGSPSLAIQVTAK